MGILHESQSKVFPFSGNYKVFIDSSFSKGCMNYGEIFIPSTVPGETKEILFSTYICHPSMGNNEVSGPTVTTMLAKWLQSLCTRKYNYRVIFVPETIGSIAYLSRNLNTLKQNTIAGFVITCVGDNLCYSFMPSKWGNTLSDKVAIHTLNNLQIKFTQYSWLERGSDEGSTAHQESIYQSHL